MAKVLIVDDSPTIATMFRRFFSQQGHEVLTAGDGRSGLDLARAQRPDLIVLDNLLPEMNGIEVCRSLKSDADLRSMKILLLTGSSDAYRYLPETTEGFVTAEEMAARMAAAGFKKINFERFMFGTIAIHWGEK